MMSTYCSKHVEAYNKHYKRWICALSWLIAKITFGFLRPFSQIWGACLEWLDSRLFRYFSQVTSHKRLSTVHDRSKTS